MSERFVIIFVNTKAWKRVKAAADAQAVSVCAMSKEGFTTANRQDASDIQMKKFDLVIEHSPKGLAVAHLFSNEVEVMDDVLLLRTEAEQKGQI